MEIKNLYIYKIEDIAIGIVRATSREDAKDKVLNAYSQHYSEFDATYATIQIDNVIENENVFMDFPDVIEVTDID